MYLSDKRVSELIRELNRETVIPHTTEDLVSMQDEYGAQHYSREHGLVLSHADGCWAYDMSGKRYFDSIATYSAIASGHGNAELIGVMVKQAYRMTSAPNRFISDTQPQLLKRICELTGQDGAILMNTGAEALDTAVKGARRWGYHVKKIKKDKAKLVFAKGNFHGRTLSAIAASSNAKYRDGFGPFPPGFQIVPYGDLDAAEHAMGRNTAAFILEPIQGEGGIVLPPPGYLRALRELCTKKNVLLFFDEIQTGLGRTGALFAGEWEGVKPDGVLLGKALGQIMPVSAFAARRDVIERFDPGSHGSTFGGTALSCAVALKSLELITRDNYALVRNSNEMGSYFLKLLKRIRHPAIREVRGKGLFIGIELNDTLVSPGAFNSLLLENGVMAGVAQQTVRFTPPLIVTKEEIDHVVSLINKTFQELS